MVAAPPLPAHAREPRTPCSIRLFVKNRAITAPLRTRAFFACPAANSSIPQPEVATALMSDARLETIHSRKKGAEIGNGLRDG